MQSEAATVDGYLDALPQDRRTTLETVRRVVLDNLPAGYEEAMNWGMITYQVPFETYPDTYNRKPLMYAALASQKHHMALYLTGVYLDEQTAAEFQREYLATGKKLDMGKSCIRFKKLDDLPLDLIGKTIASLEVDDFVEGQERIRNR